MENDKDEAFWDSVNGTQFKRLDGRLICSARQSWPAGDDVGIVTAWNPFFKRASEEQNNSRNCELKRELENADFSFQEIDACWPDGKGFERSFAVRDLTNERARRLCVKYGQAAYFYARSGPPIRVVMVKQRK